MLILLDIDGVMVTTPGWKKLEVLDDDFSSFNQRAANNLQRIISETHASIVLTTSHKSRFNISQWKNIFQRRGIFIDSLNTLDENSSNLTRKDEILNWLNNGVTESYVIIDDDKSLNDLPIAIKNKCVLTSPLVGLDEDAAVSAISILKNPYTVSSNTGKA